MAANSGWIELIIPSTFSPVPKRVMNGSEDGEVLPAAVLSGAPIELEARTVRYCNQIQIQIH
jgi:hypothetical protein